MCGIAGIIRKDGAPVEIEQIRRMTDQVSHRGPDGSGYEAYGRVALGHRRLSILDLSISGKQPMQYGDTGLSITFNGEIYNYVELRQQLEAEGYLFSTGTDTEVILAAYSKWGESAVSHFNGMWAFAIYDRRRGNVFLSRDRFGVKPLYYIETPQLFAFGSEIRQLLPLLGDVRANVASVQNFIITEAADLDGSSFFCGINKLPGGHSATFDLSTDNLTVRPFYQIQHRNDIARLRADEAIEAFRDLFESAIRLRLRSDVKVGTCLSGGLDSSSVATLAAIAYAGENGSRFSAITAVSEQESNNEAGFAKMVADASNLDWHVVRPSYADFRDSLSAVVTAQEEPYSSPSITMQYFVMQTARANGITVLLDGQGGDETLLGYEKYYAAHIASKFRNHGPKAALQALRDTNTNNAKMSPFNIAKYMIGGMVSPARYAFYKHRHRYIKNPPPIPSHLVEFSRCCRDVFKLQDLEIRSTNLPVLLRYEDKNSMAHGIEARLPFLDYRLLETSLSLPGEFKIRDGWTKWILRKAMTGRMPDEVVWRKNKFGFEAPEEIWLKAHAPEMERAVLRSPILMEMTNKGALAKGYKRLDKRTRWRLYSVALWEAAFGVGL